MELILPSSNQEVTFYIKRQIQLLCHEINLHSDQYEVLLHQPEPEISNFSLHLILNISSKPHAELQPIVANIAETIKQYLYPLLGKVGFSFSSDYLNSHCFDFSNTQDQKIICTNFLSLSLNSKFQRKLSLYIKHNLALYKSSPDYIEYVKFAEYTDLGNQISTVYDLSAAKCLDSKKHNFTTLLDPYFSAHKYRLTFGDEFSRSKNLSIRFVTSKKPTYIRQNIILNIYGALKYQSMEYTFSIDYLKSTPCIKVLNQNGIDVTKELVSSKSKFSLSIPNLESLAPSLARNRAKSIVKKILNTGVVIDTLNISHFKHNFTCSNFTKFKQIKLITNFSAKKNNEIVIFNITKNGIVAFDLELNPINESELLESSSYRALSSLCTLGPSELFTSNKQYSYDQINNAFDQLNDNFEYMNQIYFV
jgi:hypothetical protein